MALEGRRDDQTLPDLPEEDIAGSGFAITGYAVHPGLGGDAAVARLRERLRQRGLEPTNLLLWTKRMILESWGSTRRRPISGSSSERGRIATT